MASHYKSISQKLVFIYILTVQKFVWLEKDNSVAALLQLEFLVAILLAYKVWQCHSHGRNASPVPFSSLRHIFGGISPQRLNRSQVLRVKCGRFLRGPQAIPELRSNTQVVAL